MKKLLLFLIFCYTCSVFAATNFLITKGASDNCGVIIGHTDDATGDPRIVYVPAKINKPGTKIPVYLDNFDYPRYVGKRAPAYNTSNTPTTPIGHIDELASHSYAYIDSNYGIINEHQLAIGECTNLSYFTFDYETNKRILGIAQLTRLILEYCTKAKEAILLIDTLTEKYGYYGDGETLLLGDTEEGWVLEISCAPDGNGAIWVAKKVPDGEIFVAANQFRIQEISTDDPNVLHSKNLFALAEKNNWLNKDKKSFNWQRAVSPGENHHPYSSLRRIWKLFQKINPAIILSPWVEDAFTTVYPFSISPPQPLAIEDVMQLLRDHYEGTEFDLTKGLASGPYGCPTRNLDSSYARTEIPLIHKRENKQDISVKKEVINDDPTGAWERAISVSYVTYSYITQSRKDLPDPIGGKVWIGYGEPFNTCYMPCHVGIMNLPSSFYSGNPILYSKEFAGMPYRLVSNWITQCYFYAIEDVRAKQKQLEMAEISQQESIEQNALNEGAENAKEYLTSYCQVNANYIISQWWEFFHLLAAKYSDGFINIPKVGIKMGYPQWWKDQVGYKNGPTSYQKKPFK